MKDHYLVIAEVKKEEGHFNIYELSSGKLIKETILYITRRRAFDKDYYLGKIETKNGNLKWKPVLKDKVPNDYVLDVLSKPVIQSESKKDIVKPKVKSKPIIIEGIEFPTDEEIREIVRTAKSTKPKNLEIDELNWKLAVHGAMRGNNIMLLGNSGCGKTLTASSLATALERPFFRFNMGAMQDARASLIGNTHYATDKGTFFAGSEFIKAIQIPKAIILLDEYSRISHDAENIMLTVLDKDQRYIRIDEDPKTPSIKVAPGVVFVATANVGIEYHATRELDRATTDRWSTIVELKLLSKAVEIKLARRLYPELNRNYIEAFADVAEYTRADVKSENPVLSTIISTRSIHAQCALAMDGFRYTEVMHALVFNLYSDEGHPDSERGEVIAKAQSRQDLDSESPLISEEPSREEVKKAKAKQKENPFDVDMDKM